MKVYLVSGTGLVKNITRTEETIRFDLEFKSSQFTAFISPEFESFSKTTIREGMALKFEGRAVRTNEDKTLFVEIDLMQEV